MKKQTTPSTKKKTAQEVQPFNPNLNFFGAGRLLDYLEA